MSKKSLILCSLCVLCGVIEACIALFTKRQDILSVVVCSTGLLFFVLFIISVFQNKKNK